MDTLLAFIAARLKEPSTYSALASALAVIGVNVSEEWLQVITYGGMGLSVLAGILLAERGKYGAHQPAIPPADQPVTKQGS